MVQENEMAYLILNIDKSQGQDSSHTKENSTRVCCGELGHLALRVLCARYVAGTGQYLRKEQTNTFPLGLPIHCRALFFMHFSSNTVISSNASAPFVPRTAPQTKLIYAEAHVGGL